MALNDTKIKALQPKDKSYQVTDGDGLALRSSLLAGSFGVSATLFFRMEPLPVHENP
jgi:hypothetical protein